MKRAGKLTVRPNSVVLGGLVGVVTGFADTLPWWAAIVVLSPFQYADTVTCSPRTTILNVLSVRAMILCSPLYGGFKASNRSATYGRRLELMQNIRNKTNCTYSVHFKFPRNVESTI